MSLLKSGTVLFAATMLANISNYLFQFFMSRHLSLDDYGAMNAVFSVLVILGVPTTTILLVIAKYTSTFKSKGEDNKVSSLYRSSLGKVAIFGAVFFVLLFILRNPISSYLKIDSSWPVVIVGFALFSILVLTVNMGVLQGLQRFYSFGLAMGATGLLKLLFGVVLVLLGLGLNGAVGAVALAPLAAFAIAFILLSTHFKKRPDAVEGRTAGILTYGVPVLLATLAFAVLTNVDLILVKHLFTAEEAGVYSSVSVLGKTILYLPSALVLVIFPMVAEAHSLNGDTFKILDKGLLYTFCISMAGVLAFVLFPETVVTILFGEKFVVTAGLLKYYGVSMMFMAVISILMSFNLARHRTGFIYSLGVGCVLMVVLINLFHGSLLTVIFIMGGVNLSLVTVNLWMVYRERRSFYLMEPEAECVGE